MATTVLETLGTVRPDGTLELDQKMTVPAGRVRVRVESVVPAVQPRDTLVEFVQRSRRELEAAGHQFRTREEIDAELQEMRNEWDDPLEGLKWRSGGGSAKETP